MYWAFLCLAVSILALPFANAATEMSGMIAVTISAVFALLSVAFFALSGDARRTRTRREDAAPAAPPATARRQAQGPAAGQVSLREASASTRRTWPG